IQLQAALATFHGHDSLLCAGTGMGKTLPTAISLLLDDPADNTISITISPLKRLQITQANDFNFKYKIPTIAINENTPRNDEFWNV
ncbi:hypothetical protein BD779DRAFT_1425746, partial [Infundibulicybe gibba]